MRDEAPREARASPAIQAEAEAESKTPRADERAPQAPPAAREALVEVRDLRKYFPVKGGVLKSVKDHVRAVDGVTFDIRRGETLGVVGESGCGKTTLGRVLLHLTEPTEGLIRFHGTDVTELKADNERLLRKNMQIVFQDPASSLNPRMTIVDIVGEPLKINGVAKGEALRERVAELLEVVGLKKEHMHRYPHEFSGGQKQRIGIARALALNPDFVVLDEPTSALDVSVQAQVLNLLEDLQDEFDLTYMFITHALNVVHHISDRVAVMYLGRVVEMADTEELFREPLHPYTKALLSAIPDADPDTRRKDRILLQGDVPSPVDPPEGCRFHPRCPIAQDICDWSGERFVERANDRVELMDEGARERLLEALGPPAQWETDRAAVTFPPTEDPRRAAEAVEELLADEIARFYKWYDLREGEEGRLVLDFEPPLAPGGGTLDRPAPYDAAEAAPESHVAACFFAGRDVPPGSRGGVQEGAEGADELRERQEDLDEEEQGELPPTPTPDDYDVGPGVHP